MSQKKKGNGQQERITKTLIMLTAALNMVKALIDLIKALT